MLPRAHRMVKPADFTATYRRGATVATQRIVLHVQADKSLKQPALVGFVVPKKAIPKATGRNLVKRRLRHAMQAELPQLPDGIRVVVRAQAAALDASYQTLVADLHHKLPLGIKRAEAKAERQKPLEQNPGLKEEAQ
ncbi:ribonuclease P protein component [Boudabousia liubingyangii]|uniref:ribonuclease P protein component n=1 Tax=Boudabousia liubingyangii TaxID=1921764 RepID=UPI0009F909B7